MQDQHANLQWHETGVPVSVDYDDPYFSLESGLRETQHVFLAGNDLPTRFTDGFHIAELGFGSGLNLLVTWQAWRQAGMQGQLQFTSFEAFPMQPDEMHRSLQLFEIDQDLSEALLSAMRNGKSLQTDDLNFEMIIGDARETVPAWRQQADAWYLDGFSPAKNPELWGADLMQAVFDHTTHSGTAATYTAAGAVRRNLADAGFEVQRVAGFGRKRHMTIARRAIA